MEGDKVLRRNVVLVGISMGANLALQAAEIKKESVRGMVGVVPVLLGRGMGVDRYLDYLESFSGSSSSCAEAFRSISGCLKPEALEGMRSLAVTAKKGTDKLVPEKLSVLPGAIEVAWEDAKKVVPRADLVTIESPYPGHVKAGVGTLYHTEMLVERMRQ